jgi:succinate dehydrogenase/fumarate reductase flavoprotein subunit
VIPVLSGALCTKGGPRITKDGHARNVRNQPITGLYACGNVAAPVSGPGYWGPGGTIGPGVCFGYLAGIHAAKEAKAKR